MVTPPQFGATLILPATFEVAGSEAPFGMSVHQLAWATRPSKNSWRPTSQGIALARSFGMNLVIST